MHLLHLVLDVDDLLLAEFTGLAVVVESLIVENIACHLISRVFSVLLPGSELLVLRLLLLIHVARVVTTGRRAVLLPVTEA